MSKRNIGFALVAVGSIIQIISLSADLLGISAQPGIIGWKQLSGAALGLVLILIGVWLVSRKTD
jgi:hypothetical protein